MPPPRRSERIRQRQLRQAAQPGLDLRKGRLNREMSGLMREPVEGCTVQLDDGNLYEWKATFTGPPDTPYEGGTFKLGLRFGPGYPFQPPYVYFRTRIYHCNISFTGYICLDILDKHWSPALTVRGILLSIISLLSDPNPEDPMEASVADVYNSSLSEFNENARFWTNLYAKPGSDQEDSE